MSVSVLLARGLVEYLESVGIPRRRLFEAAGFRDAGRLSDADARLERTELWRLDQAAVSLTGDPALGLRLGEGAHAQAFNLVGYLTSQARTLRHAIEGLLRFKPLLSSHATGELVERGDAAILKMTSPPGAPLISERLRRELLVAGHQRLVQYFGGAGTRLQRVSFEHDAPPYASEYRRLFGGAERFGDPFTGLQFDRSLLDREQLHSNDALYAVLITEAELKLRQLSTNVGIAERLRMHLEAVSYRGRVKMKSAARHLRMSERSLRRRLIEEGVSFAALAESVQAKVAKEMLADPERTVHDVAVAMGFSNAAAFHRAFKRWTGLTPHQHRTTVVAKAS